MTEPKQMIIEGAPRESIFYSMLTFMIPRTWPEDLQRELDQYWAHYKDLADERAVVVVGALCVEDCLDQMINALFPSSTILHENRDFTFSLKIDIIQAFKLIPSRILHHSDVVRKMRNDFAHNLEFKSLLSLSAERLQAMDDAIKTYVTSYDLTVPSRERFVSLIAFICVALRSYTSHVKHLRDFLDDAHCIKGLKQFISNK